MVDFLQRLKFIYPRIYNLEYLEGLALKTLKLKLKNKDLYLAHISDQI